jgi:tRNA pseudouridine32 synthase/23S rRNA pseudouridine746 synthase
VRKVYWAVVEGGPEADEGRIDLPLGRLDVTRGWWMKPDPNGQPAATVWRVMGRSFPPPASVASGGEGGERSEPGGGLFDDSRVHFAQAQAPPTPDPSPPRVARGEGNPEAGAWKRGSPRYTWLLLEPLTGRTHQLRVHCAAMGWPVVGDAVYGSAPRTGGPPLHLHAREVVVPLYPKREPVRVVAPVPDHMRAALTACGWPGEDAAAADELSVLSKAAP